MKTQYFNSLCVKKFASLNNASTFLSIRNYHNVNSCKVADWNIVFHFSYRNALLKAKQVLEEYFPTLLDTIKTKVNLFTLLAARKELLNSFDLSLEGKNHSASAESYDLLVDHKGKIIPGIKVHRKQDLVHIYGFVAYCKIIEPAEPKYPKSEIAIAKKFLLKKTPLCRWVQFRLEENRFDLIKVQKLTITDKELHRQYDLKLEGK